MKIKKIEYIIKSKEIEEGREETIPRGLMPGICILQAFMKTN